LPNLPIILLTFVSLFSGPENGITIGFLLGFIEDSLSMGLMGINALTKTLLGFFIGIGAQKFYVANRILQFISVVIITFINDVGREVLIFLLDPDYMISFGNVLKIVFLKTLPESVLNGLIAIILFPFFEKLLLKKSTQ
ncbi:rod shape-determining protein MreD, partial [candidate division CSSED10-310 bacterium]